MHIYRLDYRPYLFIMQEMPGERKKACEINPKFIVTAPTSKEAMNLAGHEFNGQTEVLEHFLAHDGQKAEMLFVSKDFRV